MMNDFVKGVTSDGWLQCTRTNGTYLDCPWADEPDYSPTIAVHNPASIDVRYVKIKVQHGNYKVFRYDMVEGKNVSVSAEVICLERALENGTLIHDCDMHVDVVVPAGGFEVLVLEYDITADLQLPELSDGVITIESAYEKYTYFGTSRNGILFQLEKYG